jgi:response regulator of citrate/malate metabolism
MTTADTNMNTIASALLGRCNAYMVKPIDIRKLKKEIKAFALIQ